MELQFRIVKLAADFRLVCLEEGQVIEIYEGSLRRCVNRQLELLQEKSFTNEKWRVRIDVNKN